jgi:hypothetical protein
MYRGLGRSLGLAATRGSARTTQMAARQMMRSTPLESIVRSPNSFSTVPMSRPFSVLGTARWQKVLPEQPREMAAGVAARTALPSPAAPPSVLAVAPTTNKNEAAEGLLQQVAQKTEPAATGAMESVRRNGMIFEIGITYTFLHYQSILVYFARGVFQSVRPLLILFIFSQIFKALFFIAGAPIWFSFYSIWLFEVGYSLFQCALSFIFICSFYNNLSFARLRPTLAQLFRQERDKIARLGRALA